MIAAATGRRVAVLSSSALPSSGKAMIRLAPLAMRVDDRAIGVVGCA
jgi:hypothetical protein